MRWWRGYWRWCGSASAARPARRVAAGRSTFVEVVGRGWVELPAVPIPLLDAIGAFQFLVVVVGHADGEYDVVHDVLVGRGVVTARRFVAGAVSRLPVRVDIAGGQRRAGLVVVVVTVPQFLTTAAGRRGGAIEPERGWRGGGDHVIVVLHAPPFAIEIRSPLAPRRIERRNGRQGRFLGRRGRHGDGLSGRWRLQGGRTRGKGSLDGRGRLDGRGDL